MKRDYIIVCNEHKGMWAGCLLFWGHKTEDNDKRSFGGYTSNFDACERYTPEEIRKKNYNFPIVDKNIDEVTFRKMEDVIISVDDLLSFDWLKTMTVVYRP